MIYVDGVPVSLFVRRHTHLPVLSVNASAPIARFDLFVTQWLGCAS